ncbi:MAG: hypothetical protein M0C28_22110 [Candidatus Moduliflexus flocculans]|nr:hypothetical protein [Candidatus Moduliflexus flocculans]
MTRSRSRDVVCRARRHGPVRPTDRVRRGAETLSRLRCGIRSRHPLGIRRRQSRPGGSMPCGNAHLLKYLAGPGEPGVPGFFRHRPDRGSPRPGTSNPWWPRRQS